MSAPKMVKKRTAARRARAAGVTGLGIVTASLIAVGSTTGAAEAGGPPDHGVDKNGFCTPKYVGNSDCYHQTSTRYSVKDCKEIVKEINVSSVAFCRILPPDGYGVVQSYTTACKQESIEQVRKRLGTKPIVLRPRHI